MIPIPYTKLTPSYTPIRGSCRSLEYHNNARNWQHWAMILCWFNRSNSKTKLNEEHQRNRKALWKEIRRLCFYLTGYVSSLISSNSFYTTVLINLFRNNMDAYTVLVYPSSPFGRNFLNGSQWLLIELLLDIGILFDMFAIVFYLVIS